MLYKILLQSFGAKKTLLAGTSTSCFCALFKKDSFYSTCTVYGDANRSWIFQSTCTSCFCGLFKKDINSQICTVRTCTTGIDSLYGDANRSWISYFSVQPAVSVLVHLFQKRYGYFDHDINPWIRYFDTSCVWTGSIIYPLKRLSDFLSWKKEIPVPHNTTQDFIMSSHSSPRPDLRGLALMLCVLTLSVDTTMVSAQEEDNCSNGSFSPPYAPVHCKGIKVMS